MKPLHYLEFRIYRFLSAWCDLFDGIIGIITLGFWLPGISFKLCILHSKFEWYLLENHEWVMR